MLVMVPLMMMGGGSYEPPEPGEDVEYELALGGDYTPPPYNGVHFRFNEPSS